MSFDETKPRLLIVDDNPNIHKDFELVFNSDFENHHLDARERKLFGDETDVIAPQGTSYEIDHAFSGAEGVEKIRQALAEKRNYQLAFVDIRMPGMDGVETVGHIWRLDPDVQIVICTAFSDYSQEDLTRRLGQTDKLIVLKKPFDTIEVTQLASTLISKWFLARQAALKMEQMELLVARRTEKVLELQRRESQRAHEFDQMKLQFLDNFVNEFRTPLTLLSSGMEQLLAADTLKSPARNLLQNNLARLLHLVDHLVDLHSFEHEHAKPEITRGDVLTLVRGVVRIFQPVADRLKVDLRLETGDDSLVADFDPVKLEKILFLILSNALQTTSAGGHIRVASGPNSNTVQISIEISGGVMPVSSPQNPLLWLALARNLVEIQHGVLDLNPSDQTEPAAHVFVIRLPFDEKSQRADHPNKTVDETDDSKAQSPEILADKEERPTLLLIEPDAELRQHIRQNFVPEYHVIEICDGGEIFPTAREIMPDLIIADLAGLKMDEIELCRHLKSDDLTCHIPIVLIAARDDEQLQMKALQVGVDEFVVKPFRLPLLKARVNNLLEARKRLREHLAQYPTGFIPNEITVNQMDLQFVKRVTAVVEKNFSDCEFNVDVLAREIGISRRQLFRKVKAITQITPNALIRSLRLNRAAQLLRESDLTVSEITYAVGFSDLKHFREVFQEQFGVLPGNYAQRSQNG